MEASLSKMTLNQLYEIKNLDKKVVGGDIRVRGFVLKNSCTGKYIFLTLRDGGETLQCMVPRPAENSTGGFKRADFNELKKVNLESYLEISGKLLEPEFEITSCSKSNLELQISNYTVLSASEATLPFALKDASATLKDREANPSLPTVSYHLCLDNRSLDFRTPQSRAIFRVIDGVMFFFRDTLRKQDFMEIKTSKLIETCSEGGANVFSIDYFKKKAYLAQSPQLYKQMAILGGFKRVYEIGHVYRAEESNINRYLSEFVGLDIEMEITKSYEDVIDFIYSIFVSIFDGLKQEYSKELEAIRAFHNFTDVEYGKTPVVLTHRECVDMLKKEGFTVDYDDDFNNEGEKKLGALVKEQHGVDFFVIKDYPISTRAFYTYRNEKEGTTRSYDFLLRGEEVLSGAQRVNKYEDLLRYVKDHKINPETLGGYLEAFKHGAPPHGGCGIGLERLMKAYFGMTDIRYFSMFPRDPSRLYP